MSQFPRISWPVLTPAGDDPLGPPRPVEELRRKYDRLEGQRIQIARTRQRKVELLKELVAYLELAPKVDAALETLNQELFGKLAEVIQKNLTLALQEVLNQPIQLRIDRDFKRGAATMRFYIDRGGQEEDIMRGQGGSVANILSVGLRLFALTQLDPRTHRRFLLLDEQDCWLAPELVPRLVRVIHQAASTLHFQVLLITHHDTEALAAYAQKIIRLAPTAEGIIVREEGAASGHPD